MNGIIWDSVPAARKGAGNFIPGRKSDEQKQQTKDRQTAEWEGCKGFQKEAEHEGGA